MNLKLAKKLRKKAEAQTIGLPKVAYEKFSAPEFKMVNIGYVETLIKSLNGIPCRLAPCTRKKYKELKGEFKKGAKLVTI